MADNIIQQKVKAGATLIDVRSPDEFADGSYPGAKNIPVNTLPNRMAEVGAKDKAVVVFCASGGRSAVAMQMLKASGFADVTNAGGLEDLEGAMR
ncbi:MAG: rhodanese-like domain-containing protein [Spirochaetales bacterium]